MKLNRTILCTLMLLTVLSMAQAQPGTMDVSFDPSDTGNGYGDGPTGSASVYAVLPDGKVIIAGSFAQVHGYARGSIARLNTDGSLDMTFTTGVGFNSTVYCVALQSDGKLVVGGDFTSYDGVPRNRIVRLNSDGGLDPTFNPGSGFNFPALALAIQPDGKILVGGSFTQFNGLPQTKLIRLLNTGARDAGFNVGTIAGSSSIAIRALALQSNGQVIAVGNITSVNGIAVPGIARFSGSGSLDATYPASGILVSEGRTADLQADGKLVIGAYFGISAPGMPSRHVVRLNMDGTWDSGFAPPAFTVPPLTPNVSKVAIRPDGKVLVGGEFAFTYLGQQRRNMVRLNTNGSVDGTFLASYYGPFLLLPDDRIISTNGTMRLSPDGVRDATYYPGSGCNAVGIGAGASVRSLVVQPDGRILLGGAFSGYQGQDAPGIVRVGPDGIRDPGFSAALPVGSDPYHDARVQDVALQPDAKVLVARTGVDRLNVDGSLDATFDDGTGGNVNSGGRRRLALLPNGKVLVAGDFTQYNGQAIRGLVRLTATGSVDPSFSASAVIDAGMVHDIAVQEDGRIIFTDGSRVVRLNADGSLDPTFNAPTISGDDYSPYVITLKLQPDGALLIGGSLSSCDGSARPGIARLLSDGTFDSSFNPVGPDIYQPWAIALQSDGRVVIAGSNSDFQMPRKSIARLNPDGSVDADFNTGTGIADYANTYCRVEALALQADGRVLVGGTFTAYNGIGRNRIMRLNGDGSAYVDLKSKVFLDGPFNTSTTLMNDGLRSLGLLITDEPYTSLGYAYEGTGPTMMSAGILTTTGSNAIVDWVLVELRDHDDASYVLASRSALLQRDGDVVGVDGQSPVRFDVPPGLYFVSVRHRNHLGVMAAGTRSLGPEAMLLDFTHPGMHTFGTAARKVVGDKMVLWAGDVTFNGAIRYTGTGNDRDPVLITVGSFTPNNTITGYRQEDVNMDGLVKYTGAANDREPILVNVGSTMPTNVRAAQLP